MGSSLAESTSGTTDSDDTVLLQSKDTNGLKSSVDEKDDHLGGYAPSSGCKVRLIATSKMYWLVGKKYYECCQKNLMYESLAAICDSKYSDEEIEKIHNHCRFV